jgi:hypothetical protein
MSISISISISFSIISRSIVVLYIFDIIPDTGITYLVYQVYQGLPGFTRFTSTTGYLVPIDLPTLTWYIPGIYQYTGISTVYYSICILIVIFLLLLRISLLLFYEQYIQPIPDSIC